MRTSLTHCQKIWQKDSSLFNGRGIDMSFTRQLGDLLVQGQLRNVSSHKLDIPLGSWDRHLGVLMEKDLLATFNALKPIACAKLNIPTGMFDRYLAETANEWRQQRAACRFYLAYGQV